MCLIYRKLNCQQKEASVTIINVKWVENQLQDFKRITQIEE